MSAHRRQRSWCMISIATWCVLELLTCTADARVVVVSSNSTRGAKLAHRFDDVPGTDGFGPRIPATGFTGHLQLAAPDVFACSKLDSPTLYEHEQAGSNRNLARGLRNLRRSREGQYYSDVGSAGFQVPAERGRATTTLDAVTSADGLPVAVLISRSLPRDPTRCTFERKVLQAQAAGYALAIIFDHQQEALFKMGASTTDGEARANVEIPLVLVTQQSGLALQALISASADPLGPKVFVDNTDPFVNLFVTVNLTMLMVVLGFLLALLTCGSMLVVTLHRYMVRYEDLLAGTSTRLMPLPEVLRLPEVLVEEGSKLVGEACPVCLETYRVGDTLRGLPCNHAFHAACITPWLTHGQRTCPMCKDPVRLRSPSGSPTVADNTVVTSGSADGGGAATPGTQSSHARSSRRSSSASPLLSASFAGGSGGLGVSPMALYSALATAGGVEDDEWDAHQRAGGRAGAGVRGDRLPLLWNPRGRPSDGGAIGESSPV